MISISRYIWLLVTDLKVRNIIGRVLLEGHCPKTSFGEHEHGRKRYDTMNSYFLCQYRVISESLHPDDISGTPLKINLVKPKMKLWVQMVFSFSNRWFFLAFWAVQIFQSEKRFFYAAWDHHLRHLSQLKVTSRSRLVRPSPTSQWGFSGWWRYFFFPPKKIIWKK